MADRIELRGLRVLGVHGALPDEQVRAQPFEIDLDVDADLSVAGRSDHLDVLVATGFPVVVGASRKSFVGRLTGDAPVGDRREGSLASAVWCMLGGVRMVRVHDVRPTAQAAAIVDG